MNVERERRRAQEDHRAKYSVVWLVSASMTRTPVARRVLRVVDELVHDRERPQRQLAGRVGGRQRRGVAAEVGAVRAAADAAVAVLAGAAAVVRLA